MQGLEKHLCRMPKMMLSTSINNWQLKKTGMEKIQTKVTETQKGTEDRHKAKKDPERQTGLEINREETKGRVRW